jgi:hypothetical protein
MGSFLHIRVGHGSGPSAGRSGRVGSGRVVKILKWYGSGRVGSKKLDPRPTLLHIEILNLSEYAECKLVISDRFVC